MRRRTSTSVSDETTAVESVAAEDLVPELARRRDVSGAYRADELERERAQARHSRDRADVVEEARAAELARAEREAQSRADADLARLYREARAAGERIRITSAMARCGESRALRLERLRALNLKVLVPVLIGFAAWSTTGVHHGAARLIGAGDADPMWWALWLLEPVLIGAVVWIIVTRARLASAGGRLDARAEGLAIGCLGTSVLLNVSAAIPVTSPHSVGAVAAVVGGMLAHAIGPAGAAATAHLIGVVDESIAAADPWTERGEPVPLLADLDLALKSTAQSAPESTAVEAVEAVEPAVTVWPLPVGERTVLPLVAQGVRRTMGDQDGQQAPKAPRPANRPRPNKGVPVPPAARKPADAPSVRVLSDEQLRARLDALVEAGELAEGASIRDVQAALGVGFARAKRVRAMPAGAAMPGQLTVMTTDTQTEREEEAA